MNLYISMLASKDVSIKKYMPIKHKTEQLGKYITQNLLCVHCTYKLDQTITCL